MIMFNYVKNVGENKKLYSDGDNYVVASFSSRPTVPEVLIFQANDKGEVTDYCELFGYKFYEPFFSIDGVIEETVQAFNDGADEYIRGQRHPWEI